MEHAALSSFLTQYTRHDLQCFLRTHDIPVSGLKQALIKRIEQYAHDSKNIENIYAFFANSTYQAKGSKQKDVQLSRKRHYPDHNGEDTACKRVQHSDAYPKYTTYITQTPNSACTACETFLFPHQVYNLHGIPHCCACYKHIINKHSKFWHINDTSVPVGPIPLCLQHLTRIECQLISQMRPSLQILVLPGGQLGESGQAITFPNNIEATTNELPQSHLNMIVVEKEGQPCNSITIHNLARVDKMYDALAWLKVHNSLYKDITIASTSSLSSPPSSTCMQYDAMHTPPYHNVQPSDRCSDIDNACSTYGPDDCNSSGGIVYEHHNEHSQSDPTPSCSSCSPTCKIHEGSVSSSESYVDKKYDVRLQIDNMLKSGHHLCATFNSTPQPEVSLHEYMKDVSHTLSHFVLKKSSDAPISIFRDMNVEELSFPELYPLGRNGLQESRSFKLSTLKYFQHRLYHKSGKWRKHIAWLFWAVNTYEIKKLYSEINIVCRMVHQGNTSHNQVTAYDIRNTPTNTSFMNTSYAFMKNIRGTPGYWRDQLFDLLAKIHTLGCPTFFCTFSANDLQWPELFTSLDPSLTLDAASQLPQNVRWQMMTSDPVMCAIHFHRRTHALMTYVLSDKSPLGTVQDFWVRTEFQLRGSPHLHLFVWCSQAPDITTPEGFAAAPAYIDQYISTQIPDKHDSNLYSLVTRLQTHRHTACCQKPNQPTSCRFHFPKHPSDTTKLVSNSSVTSGFTFYETKRSTSDIWINAYNPTLLRIWQANMDIQLVCSTYGVAYYVCMYISKSEPQGLKDILNKVCTDLPANSTTQHTLAKIGNTVLSHRVLGAQEAAYRLCGLPLVRSSRATVWVNSRLPTKRARLLKPKQELEALSDDSDNVFISNIVDAYMYRPVSIHVDKFPWDTMSLATFVTSFSVSGSPLKSQTRVQSYIEHIDKWIIQRLKTACLRTPKFNPIDGDDYYYHMLYLFTPWRKESDILGLHKTYEDAFKAKQHLLDYSTLQNSEFVVQIEKAIQHVHILSMDEQESVAAYVAPSTSEHNLNNTDHVLDQSFIEQNINETLQTFPSNPNDLSAIHDNSLQWKSMTVHKLTDTVFGNMMSQLSPDQKQVFDIVKDTFKKRVTDSVNTHPLRIFITGGAGSGKSFIITLLREYLNRLHATEHDCVLLVAPTGVAAFNVHGITLHAAFSLPVEHTNAHTDGIHISAAKLHKLRMIYKHIKYIIIDEISMVSYKMFELLHFRLNQIKNIEQNTDAYFGNLDIFIFGDFYQLRPVFGSFVFAGTSTVHLWKDLFTPIFLRTNHRHKADSTYFNLLHRARLGTLTSHDISLLQKRIFTPDTIPPEFEHSLRIFPKVDQCKQYNTLCLQQLEKLHNITRTSISALDKIIDGPPHVCRTKDISTYIPKKTSDCAGLLTVLEIVCGSRVMLVRNIFTEHGLVNGAQGTVTSITYDNDYTNNISGTGMPKGVYVTFDDPQIGQVFKHGTQTSILIEPITTTFKGEYKTQIQRTQIPLIPCFASTVHKVQGLTLERAVLDIGDTIFGAGQAYVALSRVKTLHGVALIACNPHKIFASPAVISEMTRLTTLTPTHNSSS